MRIEITVAYSSRRDIRRFGADAKRFSDGVSMALPRSSTRDWTAIQYTEELIRNPVRQCDRDL